MYTAAEPALFRDTSDCLSIGSHVVLFQNVAGRAGRLAAYRTVVEGVASGTYLGIVVSIADGGRMRRLAHLVTARARVAAAERAILQAGRTTLEGRYGVYPSPQSPTLVFELGGSAETYATAHLIPGTITGMAAILRRTIARWAGYDPTLGAVVVVGRKL